MQENIKIYKTRFDFIWYEFEDTAIQQMHISFTREEIYRNKYLIKAMRKQIAMRPVDNNGIVKCPVCREILYDKEFLIIKTLCCPDCGQKLRWE